MVNCDIADKQLHILPNVTCNVALNVLKTDAKVESNWNLTVNVVKSLKKKNQLFVYLTIHLSLFSVDKIVLYTVIIIPK